VPETAFTVGSKRVGVENPLLRAFCLIIVAMVSNGVWSAGAQEIESAPSDPLAMSTARIVDAPAMQRVYDEVKTPYKYGVVLKGQTQDELVDCASLFRADPYWYMIYVASERNAGYQTELARSADLLHWEKLGKILSFTKPTDWDACQAAGGVALCDVAWGGSYELETYDGRYWLSYIGGAKPGYEPDPLSIGLALTGDPTAAVEWTRLPQNPVLSPSQPDVREFEKFTLYKSQIVHDKTRTVGHPFVMYYNGKGKAGYERIGMAVSDDMITWKRYGAGPVVANGEAAQRGISGDPQIARIGDLWVMFYFGAFWKPGGFDTFACSYDLVHWTKWEGKHLTEPSEPFDQKYAHKPWVVKWHEVVYHFYCAVGNQGRVIALATSRPMRP
jgi:predicted GH43/DUF377 family glycosyl hydrolase